MQTTMKKNVQTICIVVIYAFFAYFLAWQIVFFNKGFFFENEARESQLLIERYMPTIFLLLFAILLSGNIFHKQRRWAIFNCFFVSSLLLLFERFSSSAMAIVLALLGSLITIIEFAGRAELSKKTE